MNDVALVSPLEITPAQSYDLAIATIGYETRARALPERLRPKAALKVAAGFTNRQVLEYEHNQRLFSSWGWRTVDLDDEKMLGFWRNILTKVCRGKKSIRVWCDISSNS